RSRESGEVVGGQKRLLAVGDYALGAGAGRSLRGGLQCAPHICMIHICAWHLSQGRALTSARHVGGEPAGDGVWVRVTSLRRPYVGCVVRAWPKPWLQA